MFNNPTLLSLYAESRMIDDLTPRRVSTVAPRFSFTLPRLFTARKIVSSHNLPEVRVPRAA
jgi:hypothetical protein